MKHDEKKIQELNTFGTNWKDICKQYAEHMVQQERERCYEIANKEHLKARKSYHSSSWDAGVHDATFSICSKIINLIQ